ncbi:hypothetical protein BZA77DRAFT_355246 [Pyronema omphalodes]|nr:hypothetical protein BZA77DRAFT_355246 [Pyronema omphalodes]
MESNIINIKQSPTTKQPQPQTPPTTGENCGNIEPATATENKGTTTNNSPQNIPSSPVTASPSTETNTQTTVPQASTMKTQSPPNHNATLQQKSINDPNFNNPTDPDTDNPNNRELKTPLLFSAFTLPPHHLAYNNNNSRNNNSEAGGEESASGSLLSQYQQQPPPPLQRAGITGNEIETPQHHNQQISLSDTTPPTNQRRSHSDLPQLNPVGSAPRSISRSRVPELGLKVFVPPRPDGLPVITTTVDNQNPPNPQPAKPAKPQPREHNSSLTSQQIAARISYLRSQQQQSQHRNPQNPPQASHIPMQNQTAAKETETETKEEKELRIKAIRNAQASYEAGRKDDAPETPGIYRPQRLVQFEQQIRVEKIRLERAAIEAKEAKEALVAGKDKQEAGKEKDDGNAATAEEIEDHMRVIRDFADNEGAFPLKNIDELLDFGADEE